MEAQSSIAVHTVSSRGSIKIPAADLLIDGVLTVDPAVQSKGYFSVQFKGAELELTAGGFCGYIPLNRRVAVNVQPKMPVGNLSRIFDVAAMSLRRITGISRGYNLGLAANAPILEFLAAELSMVMKAVIERGLRKSYERRSYSDSYPRGKIELTPSIRKNFARGRSHVLEYSTYFLTMDIPENRLLRAAAERVLKRLQIQRHSSRTITTELARVSSYFAGAGKLRLSDIWQLSRLAQADAAIAEYAAAIDVARIILNEQSAELEKAGTDVDLTAVVVDFDALFEEYVRNLLKIDQHKRGLSAIVLDGNNAGKKALFDGKANPKAQPDVVIKSADGSVRLIVEIKYKSAPDRSDINQAIAYALSYRVQSIIIAHQASTPLDSGLKKIGSINGMDVFRYGIDLGAEQLQKEEDVFSSAVFAAAGVVKSVAPAAH